MSSEKGSLTHPELPKPLVSIIVRTKNEEKLIGKTLEALERQIFKDFEIILVDDHSTDKTLEIVRAFSARLRMTVVPLRIGEFSHPYSENLGASKSKGDFLCFLPGHSLPSSDSWLADGLSNFSDPQVAGVSGGYTEVPVGYFCRRLGALFFPLWTRVRLTFDPNLSNTGSIIRRDLWRLYPFDERLAECEDYDWACEMLARGYNIIKDPRLNTFHSHLLLGQRRNYLSRWGRWAALLSRIRRFQRPRQSYTRLELPSS